MSCGFSVCGKQALWATPALKRSLFSLGCRSEESRGWGGDAKALLRLLLLLQHTEQIIRAVRDVLEHSAAEPVTHWGGGD